MARYSILGSMPPKFEHRLRRHKQRFGKIATTIVEDKDKKIVMITVGMTLELS